VVGTFANYYKAVVREPSPVDLELTDRITRAAAIAIENARRP
jgi:GAF domain-containing protein